MSNFPLSEKYSSENKISDVADKIKLSTTENPDPPTPIKKETKLNHPGSFGRGQGI